MDEKPTPIFADGLSFELPPEKAPEWVLLKCSIHAHKLFTFLQKYQNERGYVNLEVKKSKSGKIYAEVNTWKPNPERQKEAQEYNEGKYKDDPKAKVNQQMSQKYFDNSLSDEELESLDKIPF